ncbi:MAG: M3 family metallopeptidase [Woeseia sp.]|jgi:peptidyl-dipeptidase Dcp|nr:M3 family metallopeptidase [Woeseia sp.]MBT6209836.1 M3 family metallopeptidase [Woeseia sp.]
MRIPHNFIALAFVLLFAACGKEEAPMQSENESTEPENPLLVDSGLPYGAPAFDMIKNEHFSPALENGMAEQAAEIELIASNPESATFENTIEAMEKTGQTLGRSRRIFGALISAHTNAALDDINTEMSPKFAAHRDSILLNADLYARVAQLYLVRESLGLDAESLRLLDRYHTDFVRAGAQLSDDQKARLRAINADLAALSTAFSQAVLDDVNDSAVIVESREELAGMTENQIESAAKEGVNRGLDGKYVVTLRNTTQQPPLTVLKNRALRQRIQEVSAARGSRGNEFDTRNMVTRVLHLRAERAAMIGYETHAAYILDDSTAKTVAAVNDMLGQLGPRAVANAVREAADLQQLINDTEDDPFEIAAWDWLYYTEKLRKRRYSFDETQLKPYFELNRSLTEGVFYMAEHLYGVTLEARPDLPVYQEDVSAYEAFLDNEALGLFYFDPYARDSKRGGAWMNSYVSQSNLLGSKPVVANHLNIVKPPEGEPTLLTMDEVNTMFHEFGHALHGLFSDVTYPRFSGTSVPRDFVEYPSQVHEMWATWPEVLANYAVHYETGEAIPQELLEKVRESKKFNQGFDQSEYMSASIVDQALHQLPIKEIPPAEALMEQQRQILAASGMDFSLVPPRYSAPYFSHIMSGYSAGYYSYIWSEVLDADSVKWFEENGGLTRENGDHFRNALLSKGGSRDAMTLFEEFRGAEPSIEPLLDRLGLN